MKSKIPTWFQGNIYSDGKTLINPKTNKGIKINNIEASIYDVVNGHLMQLKEFEKNSQQSKIMLDFYKNQTGITDSNTIISSIKNEYELGVEWFKENNITVYKILIEDYDITRSISEVLPELFNDGSYYTGHSSTYSDDFSEQKKKLIDQYWKRLETKRFKHNMFLFLISTLSFIPFITLLLFFPKNDLAPVLGFLVFGSVVIYSILKWKKY
jgi:hypothetical protein